MRHFLLLFAENCFFEQELLIQLFVENLVEFIFLKKFSESKF